MGRTGSNNSQSSFVAPPSVASGSAGGDDLGLFGSGGGSGGGSKGDPNYEGKYEAGLFEGSGVYSYPDGKAKYVGEFSRGLFHGEGSMLVPGGKFSGRWEKGKMVHGLFVFDDGLQHKKLGTKTWDYCSQNDRRLVNLEIRHANARDRSVTLHLFRRFYPEIKAGVPKSKLQLLAVNMSNFSKVPPGCYDTVDGYFHPKKSCIYDYNSGDEVRVINSEEREWIIKNCREATEETYVPPVLGDDDGGDGGDGGQGEAEPSD
jgi:hypothetical protein